MGWLAGGMTGDSGGWTIDEECWETPAVGCPPGMHLQTSITHHITTGTLCSLNATHAGALAQHILMTQKLLRQDKMKKRQQGGGRMIGPEEQ
jgi:hypothetical protein